MSETAALRSKIKHLLVDALRLEGIVPSQIADDAPLFGGASVGETRAFALQALQRRLKVIGLAAAA